MGEETKIEEKPGNAGENQDIRNEKGQFKPGVSGNPAGKPVGTLSFATKWDIFIEKVAKQNNMTPQEIDEQLFAVGFKKAKEGDYNFYKDVHDRKYGRAVQPTDITSGGKTLEIKTINYILPEETKDNGTINNNTADAETAPSLPSPEEPRG